MQWWCSAQGTTWTWQWQAYPGVWLFLLAVGAGIVALHRRAARRELAAGRPASAALHPATVGGLLVLWLSLDWPIGALGAGYLASVHMLQFLLMALVAAPLLLLGMPAAVARLLMAGPAGPMLRRLTTPFFALVFLNLVVLLTHTPRIADTLMATQLGSFAIDLLWIAAGLLFWWPVIAPEPHRPRFAPPLRIGYLLVGLMFSPVMFGLAGFLAYGETPLFRTYELAPPIAGIASRDDHQVAGVLMSVGGALVAFVGISSIFFRWSRETA